MTHRHFSAGDKIRFVLDGLRGEDRVAELCRKEGIAQRLYYTSSKEFMAAGPCRLSRQTGKFHCRQPIMGARLINQGPLPVTTCRWRADGRCRLWPLRILQRRLPSLRSR